MKVNPDRVAAAFSSAVETSAAQRQRFKSGFSPITVADEKYAFHSGRVTRPCFRQLTRALLPGSRMRPAQRELNAQGGPIRCWKHDIRKSSRRRNVIGWSKRGDQPSILRVGQLRSHTPPRERSPSGQPSVAQRETPCPMTEAQWCRESSPR